jgi:hypothetical protein
MIGINGSVTASQTSTSGKASGSESTNTGVRVLDNAQEEELKGLLTQFGLGATGPDKFSRANALRDINGNVKQLFTDYSEQVVPKILEQQQGTGGYSGSGAQLLSNDAFARTVAQAATLQQGAVKDYAAMSDSSRTLNLQGLSTTLQGLLGAKKNTTEDSNFSSNNSSKSTGLSTKVSGGYSIG